MIQKWVKSGITGNSSGPPLSAGARFLTQTLGTGFGTGYAPVAQGTAGSLLFVLLWWFFVPNENPLIQGVIFALLTAISIPLSAWGERLWGHDPGRITIDEFVGQAVALYMIPHEWPLFLAAFLLFRLFDTFKFRFIRKHIETLPDGWGVTLDDLVAGFFARVCMIPVVMLLQGI